MHPIIAIQGGLGNQLSQWSYAHSHPRIETFQIDLLKGLGSTEHRDFELKDVLDNCPHIKKNGKGEFKTPISLPFFHLLDRLWQFSQLRLFVEKLGYIREDPRFDQVQTQKISKSFRYAKGYFQKQQNVENAINHVSIEIIPIVLGMIPMLTERFRLGENYSVLHVRRGDYETTDFSPVNIGTLSDDYFLRGVTNFSSVKLIILTENRMDIEDLITSLNPDLVLDKRNTSPWETLAIMFGATNFLGSNSSLSWWGARMCAMRGGNVWLPSQWSYWENINPGDYHFPSCNIADVYWKQDGQSI
jgi:hypothetical protein